MTIELTFGGMPIGVSVKSFPIDSLDQIFVTVNGSQYEFTHAEFCTTVENACFSLVPNGSPLVQFIAALREAREVEGYSCSFDHDARRLEIDKRWRSLPFEGPLGVIPIDEIPLLSMLQAADYVFTNTNLVPSDPRRELIAKIRACDFVQRDKGWMLEPRAGNNPLDVGFAE